MHDFSAEVPTREGGRERPRNGSATACTSGMDNPLPVRAKRFPGGTAGQAGGTDGRSLRLEMAHLSRVVNWMKRVKNQQWLDRGRPGTLGSTGTRACRGRWWRFFSLDRRGGGGR